MEILASGLVDRMKYNTALIRIIQLENEIAELKQTLADRDRAFRSIYSVSEAQDRAKEIGSYD
jgi:hypothetical protein